MRVRNLRNVILIIFILFLLYFIYTQSNKSQVLFTEEDINPNNIAHIEILDILTNENVVIDDTVGIEKISSFLIKLKSNKTSADEVIDKPLYYIYIINNGKHANNPIGVSKDSIMYKGNKKKMSTEESSFIIQFLDDEIRN
ncbi:hypothetical protein [Sporosarcina sp. FSL K6-2383]|uniref:hypothetical protein n=1 Tax=Sporosarcina sp. FSL K6-2383 TaxID=2921556 RepID=UPI00315AB4AB